MAHSPRAVNCLLYVDVRRTFLARGPFGPSTTSNSTESPSRRSLIPSPKIADWWKKDSFPAESLINPKPLSTLSVRIVPARRIPHCQWRSNETSPQAPADTFVSLIVRDVVLSREVQRSPAAERDGIWDISPVCSQRLPLDHQTLLSRCNRHVRRMLLHAGKSMVPGRPRMTLSATTAVGIRRNTLQWRMLKISPRTVRRDWEFARGWLAREQPPSSGRRA